LPPGQPDAGRFDGVGWGDVQAAEGERGYKIVRWEEEDGPLARTDEGISLPLPQTVFLRRQVITGQKNSLAAFDDGVPFLARRNIGRGEAVFCASLPKRDWSSLAEGPVLVPMLQRMAQAGSRRLQSAATIACGELSAADRGRKWTPVDSSEPKDILTRAGVYRSGERLLAVNRPVVEDEPEVIEESAARHLFGTLPLQTFQERQGQTNGLEGEVWRIFLFGMLILLVAEGFLILPSKAVETPASAKAPTNGAKETRTPELVS
ncbi:MAG TPA: hypothetical protein VHH73_17550, partial [Verrucomicrobiae bacterium]|nr:hypothetical protein [Verrucomicrobiae bacterium]